MAAKKVKHIDSAELRHLSEERLRENGETAQNAGTGEEPLRLLHELKVHQIELEMQNEELLQARAEREKMEALLGKYSDLYDFAPVGYFNLDHGGIILAVNFTGAGFLEVERSLLINMRLDLFISDETRPDFHDFLDKVFASESKETCEVELLGEKHSQLFVQIEAMVSESREECRAVVIDITERKRANAALQESEERFRLLIDGAKDYAIIMLDVDGRVISWNEGARRLKGWDGQEILGRHFSLFYTEEEVAAGHPESELELAAAEGRYTEEGWRVRKNGSKFMADVIITAIRDESGKLRGFSKVTRDITDRKHAEELIRQERELCLDMVNKQPAGMYRVRVSPRAQWSKDAWKSSELTPYSVELVNDRFCEILGINRQDMETKPGIAIDLVHPEDRAEFALKNEEAATKLIPFQWEGRLIVQGKILWAHFESLPRPLANGDVFWTGILYDITERNRLLETLKLREHYQRALLDNFPFAAWMKDKEGRYLAVNRQLAAYHGVQSPEELVGKTVFDFLPLDIAIVITEKDRKVLLSGCTKHAEEQLPISGVSRWFDVYQSPIIIDGQVIGAVGCSWDIHERHEMEEALRDSRLRLEQIFAFLPDATFAIDMDGRVIAWNRVMEELTGISAADMLGKGDYEYSIPIYGRRRPLLADLVISGKEEYAEDYEFLHKEGNKLIGDTKSILTFGVEHYFSGIAAPLFDSEGKMIGAIEHIHDNTKLRQAEERLKESEELYRKLVELSPDAVFIHTEGRFVFMNTTAARLLGAERPETLYGRAALDFVHPDCLDAVAHRIENAWSHKDNPPIEELLVRLDGSTVPVEMVSVYFNYQGADSVLAVA
jgi:PAS domain S-box-containing protein